MPANKTICPCFGCCCLCTGKQGAMASVRDMYHCIDALVAMITQGCSNPTWRCAGWWGSWSHGSSRRSLSFSSSLPTELLTADFFSLHNLLDSKILHLLDSCRIMWVTCFSGSWIMMFRNVYVKIWSTLKNRTYVGSYQLYFMFFLESNDDALAC